MKGKLTISRQLSILLVASSLLVVPLFTTTGRAESVGATTGLSPMQDFYAIQVAASKVFMEPGQIKKKLGIDEEIRYFVKDGWYKYYFGHFSTEEEADRRLAGLKIDAFVTRVEDGKEAAVKTVETTSAPESPPVSQASDSGDQDSVETKPVAKPVAGIRELYFRKVLEADSLFNRQVNLKKAKTLYREASALAPEKNYPRDQIIEIDKLLRYKESQTFWSRLSQRTVIIGFLFLFFLAIGVIYFLNRRKSHKIPALAELEKPEIAVPMDSPAPVANPLDVAPAPVKRKVVAEKHEDQRFRLDAINEVLEWSPILSKYLKDLSAETWDDKQPAPEGLLNEIRNALDSDDVVLRMESELAMMRLVPGDPLSFLLLLQKDFTSYEQVHVYEAIHRWNLPVPEFKRWADSGNPSVALFCRRMIRVFRQEVAGSEADAERQAEPVSDDHEWPVFHEPGLQECAEHVLTNHIRQDFFGGF